MCQYFTCAHRRPYTLVGNQTGGGRRDTLLVIFNFSPLFGANFPCHGTAQEWIFSSTESPVNVSSEYQFNSSSWTLPLCALLQARLSQPSRVNILIIYTITDMKAIMIR